MSFIKDLVKPDTLLAFVVATLLYYQSLLGKQSYLTNFTSSIIFAIQFVIVFLLVKNIIGI